MLVIIAARRGGVGGGGSSSNDGGGGRYFSRSFFPAWLASPRLVSAYTPLAFVISRPLRSLASASAFVHNSALASPRVCEPASERERERERKRESRAELPPDDFILRKFLARPAAAGCAHVIYVYRERGRGERDARLLLPLRSPGSLQSDERETNSREFARRARIPCAARACKPAESPRLSFPSLATAAIFWQAFCTLLWPLAHKAQAIVAEPCYAAFYIDR